jgi:putative membrane protein
MGKATKMYFSFALALLAMMWFSQASHAQANQPASRQSDTEAQWKQSKTTSSSKSEAKPDERFVRDAGSGGMAEVKLGQLAQEKGSNEAVKNFGKRMVEDHRKAAEDLKAAASQSGVTVPTKINARDEATYNRLSRMSGAAFDREYAKEMVTDHAHDVAEFRKEAVSGKDASIKEFASQTLPTLRDHLKQAREMEKAVSSQAAERPSG